MKQVASEFSKILWKKRAIEYIEDNPDQKDRDLSDFIDGRIGGENYEELTAWEDYFVDHYRAPSGSFKERAPGREYVD